MKRLFKRNTIYLIVRIVIGLLFVMNVVGFFLVKDDSQQGRLVFNAFQSLGLLLASTIPGFVERKTKLNIPDFMEIIFIFMCIAHFALGEMAGFFVKYSWWDEMLHTLSGSMIAILGFSLINTINQEKINMNVMPFFVAIFATSFSISIGVLWEMVEFAADGLTGSNMQRYLNSNTGEPFIGRAALFDTMKDFILDTIGAVVISIIGYIDMKKEKEAFSKWTMRKFN